MVHQTATDASGAVGAAYIDVEARLKPQPAKPSNSDDPSRSRRKHQDIRSRFGFDRCQLEARLILSLGGGSQVEGT